MNLQELKNKPRKGDILYLTSHYQPEYQQIKITGWLYDKPENNIAKFEYVETKKTSSVIVYFERTGFNTNLKIDTPPSLKGFHSIN